MTSAFASDLRCDADGRRAELLVQHDLGRGITGIDYVEVRSDQCALDVYFLRDQVPAGLVGRPDRVAVAGGRRVRVKVIGVTTSVTGGRPHLVVEVDQPGDFSEYTLELAPLPELDEVFRRCRVDFKVGCPSRFDCAPPPCEVPEPGPRVPVDYLAKDYASFRHALLDLGARLSPDWTERLAADLGVTIVELLAYVGDQLSYYQDAISNELFLATSRQRISVRRRARMVDYQLHDGASARTFVHCWMTDGADVAFEPAARTTIEVLTRITEPIDGVTPQRVISSDRREQALGLADVVFQASTGSRLHWLLNEVRLHDWGDNRCCLPVGATSVDLAGDLLPVLRPGDLLLLEETKDPETGDSTLADPSHRQVVRLVRTESVTDNLLARPVTRVRWAEADALTFPLCITGADDDGTPIGEVSVARGNLLVVDHGRPVAETGCVADPILSGNRAARFTLEHGPLSFHLPVPLRSQPAAHAFAVDPHGAAPMVRRTEVGGTSPPDDWKPASTLIGADRFDHTFAVETGNDGKAMLRFGDGVFGLRPPPDATFDVEYLVGVGPEGNVGPEAVYHVVSAPQSAGIEAVRNPLPAWGGTAPESATRAKRLAPAAFRATQMRAVTEADYAEVTERHPEVRRAVARFRWTGSWHTVFISVDPAGRLDLQPALAAEVRRHVEGFAMAGYDVKIEAPRYVPLQVDLDICAGEEHFRPDVEVAVRRAIGTATLTGGRLGFFHPDNFTFGQPLYLSRLFAAVAAVEGVASVVATRFARLTDEGADLDRATAANLARGAIDIGRLEILRLDDDPDFPDQGLLRLTVRGGK